jgi:hypothetical protein
VRALQLIGETTVVDEVTDKVPRPAPHRLRTRAEQIADGSGTEQRDPAPTIRRLPVYEPPAKQPPRHHQ